MLISATLVYALYSGKRKCGIVTPKEKTVLYEDISTHLYVTLLILIAPDDSISPN